MGLRDKLNDTETTNRIQKEEQFNQKSVITPQRL